MEILLRIGFIAFQVKFNAHFACYRHGSCLVGNLMLSNSILSLETVFSYITLLILLMIIQDALFTSNRYILCFH